MRAIGVRVEKDKVHWSVVEGTPEQPVLVADDKFSAPKTYDVSAQLAWYRKRVRTLIEEYAVDHVAVRYAETFLRHKLKPNVLASMYARARIEGVVVEAAASLNVPVLTGTLGTISAGLGSRRAKSYLESGEIRGIDLNGKPTNRREAILTAAAALAGEEETKDGRQG